MTVNPREEKYWIIVFNSEYVVRQIDLYLLMCRQACRTPAASLQTVLIFLEVKLVVRY